MSIHVGQTKWQLNQFADQFYLSAEAADILEAAGFVVTDVEGKPNAEVLATNPPAGEGHRLGTSIVLFTR